MQDAVRFLETLGQDVAIGRRAYAELVASSAVEGAQKEALLNRDVAALGEALGARLPYSGMPYFCMVATPDGGETGQPEEAPDKDGDDDRQTEEDPGQRESPD